MQINQFNEVVIVDSGTTYLIVAIKHIDHHARWTVAVVANDGRTIPRSVTYSCSEEGAVGDIRNLAHSWIADREREAALIANLEHIN